MWSRGICGGMGGVGGGGSVVCSGVGSGDEGEALGLVKVCVGRGTGMWGRRP